MSADRRRQDAQREYRLRVQMGEPPLRAASALPSFPSLPAPATRPALRVIKGGAADSRPRRAVYLFGRGEDPA